MHLFLQQLLWNVLLFSIRFGRRSIRVHIESRMEPTPGRELIFFDGLLRRFVGRREYSSVHDLHEIARKSRRPVELLNVVTEEGEVTEVVETGIEVDPDASQEDLEFTTTLIFQYFRESRRGAYGNPNAIRA